MRSVLFVVIAVILFGVVEACQCWTNFWNYFFRAIAKNGTSEANPGVSNDPSAPDASDPDGGGGTNQPDGGPGSPGMRPGSVGPPGKTSNKPNTKSPTKYNLLDMPVVKLGPPGDETVLYNSKSAPERIKAKKPPVPHPETFQNVWQADYVKMPCSNQNVWKDPSGKTSPRWAKIKEVLSKASSWRSGADVRNAILSYLDKDEYKTWDTDGLVEFVDSSTWKGKVPGMLPTLLPWMANLALRLPELVTGAIPILKSDGTAKKKSISMTQEQAACILANMFFCTFPFRYSKEQGDGLPKASFHDIYLPYRTHPMYRQKIMFFIHYFKRIMAQMPVGTLTYERNKAEGLNWLAANKPFLPLTAYWPKDKKIEDNPNGAIQADFANQIVGGGVIGRGNVQEEILFLMSPETVVPRLFMPKMSDDESVKLIGCERFSNSEGYGRFIKWFSDHQDARDRDDLGRKLVEIVAIDALNFNTTQEDHTDLDQFSKEAINRELNKAYVGFLQPDAKEPKPIATGNWGCGAFLGNYQLKSIIQYMAAAAAGVKLHYYIFEEADVQGVGILSADFIDKMCTVASIYEKLLQYYGTYPRLPSTDNHLYAHFYYELDTQRKQLEYQQYLQHYQYLQQYLR